MNLVLSLQDPNAFFDINLKKHKLQPLLTFPKQRYLQRQPHTLLRLLEMAYFETTKKNLKSTPNNIQKSTPNGTRKLRVREELGSSM